MGKSNIQISDETKALIKKQGKMGETYDQVILRLLKGKQKEETR